MTYYAPCFHCEADKATCQRRNAVKAAIAGLGITSLKFACPDRRALFAAGQRVVFNWSLWESDGYDPDPLPLSFTGTVLRERGPKFVVQVDAGQDASGEGIEASEVFKKNDQLLVKVKPADMRPLDEPSRRICTTCYWVEGAAEDRCYKMPDQNWIPNGCIDRAREAQP